MISFILIYKEVTASKSFRFRLKYTDDYKFKDAGNILHCIALPAMQQLFILNPTDTTNYCVNAWL